MLCPGAGKTIGRIAVLLAVSRLSGVQAAFAEKPPAAVVAQPPFAAQLLATFDSGLKQRCTITFTPDGKRLIVSNDYGATLTWDIAGRKRMAFHPAPVRRPELAYHDPHPLPPLLRSPDGKTRVAALSRHRIVMRQRTTGRRRVFAIQNGDVQAVAFTPDSRRLLIAVFTQDGERQDDGQSAIHVIDVKTGRLSCIVKAGDYRLDAFAFSHSGALLATRNSHWFGEPSHGTDVVKVWDTRSWKARHEYATEYQVWNLRFTADEYNLLALCHDWRHSEYRLNKYRLNDGQEGVVPIFDGGEATRYAGVELSQDATLIVSTAEGHAICQNVATGESIALFDRGSKTYGAGADNLALSEDNRLIADVDANGIVTLWQMPPLLAWRRTAAGK